MGFCLGGDAEPPRERRASAPPRRRRLRRAAQQAPLAQVVGLLPAAAGDKGLLALCAPALPPRPAAAPPSAPFTVPSGCASASATRPGAPLTARGGAGPRSGGGRCRL
jgi:hypothetical protein